MSIDAPSELLSVEGITKTYGPVRALDGANFTLRPREIHALLGDNGAGKSTLIKVLSGVVTPDSGRILIDDTEVHFTTPGDAHQAGIETVYQDLALATTLDASDNVFLGREVLRSGLRGRWLRMLDRKAMRITVQSELGKLGISLKSVLAPVATLSGGQRQAVAVARAAVWGRRILILDEPAAALGVAQTEQVLRLIERVRDEQGLAVILITHSLPEAFRVADRVTVLRLGKAVLTGPMSSCTTQSLIAAMTGADGVGRGG